uniref:Uncharacterized protein n=1 Tax=Anguilla anguilla TaxID=7936 RepID=A0A0E9SXJ2_ANGAN
MPVWQLALPFIVCAKRLYSSTRSGGVVPGTLPILLPPPSNERGRKEEGGKQSCFAFLEWNG